MLRVHEQRHGVSVLAHDHGRDASKPGRPRPWCWRCRCSSPRASSSRRRTALRDAAARVRHAPWLVANLRLDAPPLPRLGAPPAWDNVVYGSRALGYVDAGHQLLRPDRQATVLTFYEALPESARGGLLNQDPRDAAQGVLDTLAPVHPDLALRARQIDLVRHGHAMAVPRPGVRNDAARGALAALRGARGRLRFAHADLSGYSVFEEAFTLGTAVADPVPPG